MGEAGPRCERGTSFGMRFIEAVFCHEVSGFPGAKTFLVVELTEHDEDVSYLVDQGIHFSSVRELEQHLTRVTGEDVDVHEVTFESGRAR